MKRFFLFFVLFSSTVLHGTSNFSASGSESTIGPPGPPGPPGPAGSGSLGIPSTYIYTRSGEGPGTIDAIFMGPRDTGFISGLGDEVAGTFAYSVTNNPAQSYFAYLDSDNNLITNPSNPNSPVFFPSTNPATQIEIKKSGWYALTFYGNFAASPVDPARSIQITLGTNITPNQNNLLPNPTTVPSSDNATLGVSNLFPQEVGFPVATRIVFQVTNALPQYLSVIGGTNGAAFARKYPNDLLIGLSVEFLSPGDVE